MEQIKKALRKFELILTEFAGIEKIMTEERRLQMLQICKDAQKQANDFEKPQDQCTIHVVSNTEGKLKALLERLLEENMCSVVGDELIEEALKSL